NRVGQLSAMVVYDLLCSYHSCFFFQAEDGIRDATVTGVQTCALPIFGSALGHPNRVASQPRTGISIEQLLLDFGGPPKTTASTRGDEHDHADLVDVGEIGRASCRERV